ncbi:LLM class F420-dependent oxidoreductase [Georgenia wangjunii]|uniref:LLM class F420-dependent oxidoreductase n=1 Tax=Georgenia wangjunii TaxID=3117730 RepID=UPI002F261520
MKLGVHIMRFDYVEPADLRAELAAACAAAEEGGLSWLSVMDHYFQMERAGFPAEDPMLEAYTTLGYLAGATSTVQLGVLVSGVTYRHPGLLAKIVATLDVLSGGRATFGIGAAWYEREHAAMGVPFPPLAERFERLEETLQICLQMWDPGNDGPYTGTHYRLAETLCSPLPLARPHPEVLIGGSGERKTLRLVAQYGDACNLFATTPDEVAHKLDVLRRHCDDVGRDPAEVRTTLLASDDRLEQGDLDGFVREMGAYAPLGVDTVILRPPARGLARWIERSVAPAVPRLAELG